MTPACQRVRAQWLERFAAGAPADAALGTHWAECEPCRTEIESWQQTALAVRRWRVEASADLRPQTLLRLRQHGEKLRRRRQAYQLLIAASVISAAVNAASFRLVWACSGLLRTWWHWPAGAQPALLAAWAASPLLLVAGLLWLLHTNPADGPFTLEDFHHD